VFSCLNPDQGWAPQPSVLSEIAQHRQVWAIPWLEGDARLWHLQPRANLLREHVRLAAEQKLAGVIAIHWRTEETRANLEMFGQASANPANVPALDDFYQQDCSRQFGPGPAAILAPLLIALDREQAIATDSPEYYPYEPTWGRLKPDLRSRLEGHLRAIKTAATKAATKSQRANVNWLADNIAFTLLLDEVGRHLEPAYRLKEQWLSHKIAPNQLADAAQEARQLLAQAPLKNLFVTFARRVRSKGELGELSSLNQRVWLQYRELDAFLKQLP